MYLSFPFSAQTFCTWKLLIYSVEGTSQIKIAFKCILTLYYKATIAASNARIECFPLQKPQPNFFFLKRNNAYSTLSGTNINLPGSGIFIYICPMGMKVRPKSGNSCIYISPKKGPALYIFTQWAWKFAPKHAIPAYMFAKWPLIYAQKRPTLYLYLPYGHEN